ncbi:MAG: DUF4358 domain-containing protein [Clostridia bacterium]|nr:DUF4358 domain-containing protein [Clostridia bacterium]
MKKYIALILIAALSLMLCACGKKTEAPAPTAVPTAEPTKAPVSADLAAAMAKFTFDGEMMELSASDLLDFYGIEEADVKQYAACIATTGIDCDEVVLIEAVSAEAAARVKTALDNRYQAKLNETDNYLPDENAIIKTCSVAISDNYVSMIVAPNAADLVKLYNESFK